MVAWESISHERLFVRDYAEIWRAPEKIVYSRTLESVSSGRTRSSGTSTRKASGG